MFQAEVVEKNKNVIFNNPPPPKILAFVTCNVERHCRAGQSKDDSILRRMRIACCIRKASNSHSEYVILIALQLQQWLHERVSMLRYTFIACPVCKLNFSHQRG